MFSVGAKCHGVDRPLVFHRKTDWRAISNRPKSHLFVVGSGDEQFAIGTNVEIPDEIIMQQRRTERFRRMAIPDTRCFIEAGGNDSISVRSEERFFVERRFV